MLVEDDQDTADLIIETLLDHFGQHCVTHHASITSARAADVQGYDLVLTDMNLPDGSGLDLLEEFLRRRGDLPIVLVTAEGILENAITAIRRGAYDYVVKAGDYLFAIPVIVEKNLAIYRTKQDNHRLQLELEKALSATQAKNEQLQWAVSQLERMAATDPLTGLANRRAFNEALARSFADAQRRNIDLACVMIDLDGFKRLNDTLGHQSGDEILQLAATMLERNSRRSDVAGRFGGDEFVLLLPQADEATAAGVAERVREGFQAEASRRYRGTLVTMSMGLATLALSKADRPEALLAQADHALYRAKQDGKSRLVVYGDASLAVCPLPPQAASA
jgi:diguanylate cyclase (GGDEF)-like protein